MTPQGNRALAVLRPLILSLGLLVVLIALWWLASHAQWVSKVFLPTPESTLSSLADGLTQGDLVKYTRDTILRMIAGWLLASAIGLVLGVMLGLSPALRSWFGPMLEFMRPLPASAIIPVGISIFGLSDVMVLFVVAFGAMWPVLFATSHGLASVNVRLREVAAALQLCPVTFVIKIGLPNALPDILSGMRLAVTVSLIVAVVGEMISSQSGLGQAILLAARSFRASELFAGIILLGLIGFASNGLLAVAERRFLKWQAS